MNPIIEVNNLSKSYTITHEGRERYTNLRDVIAKKTKKIFSFPSALTATSASKEEFWALKDINFDINPGDRVGIIGRNGAGKSTLLKILSRITEPTTGQIKIKGRVASLLEVGTGFHPELTGRENVYLNGAILGMSRVEIKKHFDAIIDFAGVEKFLDTPVKRYSSGMYVRLAFAVAAHLEPEILVVDEVLAVGDAEFQKKCLGKMEQVSKGEGRTVLFVSHNLSAVRTLCNTGLLLHAGKIYSNGHIENVIKKYNQIDNDENKSELSSKKRTGLGEIKFERFEILTENFDNVIKAGGKVNFDLHYQAEIVDINAKYEFVIGVWNIYNKPMFMITNNYIKQTISLKEISGTIRISIPRLTLNAGKYSANLLIRKNGIEQDFMEGAFEFEVEEGNYYSSGIYYPENYEGFYTDFNMVLL